MANNDLLIYNALDSACTKEIEEALWPDLEKDNFSSTYEMTMRLFEPLQFMMTKGLRVDNNELNIARTDISTRADKLQEELNRLAGRVLNPLSPKDCQTYFYVEKGITPYYNAKTGRVTTDDDAMLRLSKGTVRRAGLREAKLVQEIRSLRKLFGTYLEIEFDGDGRLRCSYNPRGTKFGRLSSSKTVFGSGMNLQNLPAVFKRFVVADDGYALIEFDKRQAEWVVVAYLTGDPSMLRVVENNLDPHVETSRLMFNLPAPTLLLDDKLVKNFNDPVEIRRLRASTPELVEWIDKLPRTMSGRQMGKKSNHSLNYGEGYRMFANIAEIDEVEGRRIHGLYHTVYPGVKHWWLHVQNQLSKDRTLTNCFGRKIRFMDAWGDDLFKAAYSSIPQSTVVDGLNLGMCELYEDHELCGLDGCNIDLLAQVHDSILIQVPLTELETIYAIVNQICTYLEPEMEYGARRFKIATDIKVGYNWGIYHPDHNPKGMTDIEIGIDPSAFEARVRRTLNVGSGVK